MFSGRFRQLCTICALAFVLHAPGSWALHVQNTWPSLPAPPRAQEFQIGQNMILNGAPVRIQGYLVPASISWLRTWYREQIQDPVVENRIGKKLVLGQRREGYYMTVELEPVMGTRDGEYTKVLFSVMSLDERDGHGPQALPEELRNWARRLPPDTQIFSELSDHESGKHSLHLTASNRHGADYNESHIGRVLASMGLAKQMPAETGLPRSVLFSGNGREAALVLDRTRDGASTMVLNLFIHAAQP